MGILLKNHFETLLSLIIRKPVPNELIEKTQHESTIRAIKWVGNFFIILGIGIALMGIASMGMTSRIPTHNFNF
ncbi:MAG TPA: hypothetical protein VKA27_16570 [Sunxiuqinia sp.]|nr:hypothetical protein [Sunxiuqinia sp.]